MLFLELTIFQANSNRPAKKVKVNMDKVSCIEDHHTGSRIQFSLGEPSLYVEEEQQQIFDRINQSNKPQLYKVPAS